MTNKAHKILIQNRNLQRKVKKHKIKSFVKNQTILIIKTVKMRKLENWWMGCRLNKNMEKNDQKKKIDLF